MPEHLYDQHAFDIPLHLSAPRTALLSDEDVTAVDQDGRRWTHSSELNFKLWKSEDGHYLPPSAVKLNLYKL